ncbi:MAG: winged helix-turn-helix domain-containing protein [Proteobacteria bacterium]|nr:winged helix-turn-helix domain-containing protein [Pseudomonadota bacterium]
MTEPEKKERLRNLKNKRREYIQRATQRVKENNAAIKKIKTRLADGPATVPELAQAAGLTTRETLWFVSALKKYGQVAEGAKNRGDSYFPYSLVPENSESEKPAAD